MNVPSFARSLLLVLLLCSSLQPLLANGISESSGSSNTRRVIVTCNGNPPKEGSTPSCLEAEAGHEPLMILKLHHVLESLNAFVATMHNNEIDRLRQMLLVAAIHDDVKRYPQQESQRLRQQQQQQQQSPRDRRIRSLRYFDKAFEEPYGLDMIQAYGAWEKGVTGQNVTVCIVDTGIDSSHPDLQRSLQHDSGLSTDIMGHGTHVAGIVARVAPNVKIISVPILHPHTTAHASDVIAAALECEARGATVLSLSLGGSHPNPLEAHVLQRLLEQKNIISVAASATGPTRHFYPASYPHVIAVTAVDEKGQLASFVNTFSTTGGSRLNKGNDWVVAAPGVNVWSTLPLQDPCILCHAMQKYKYGRLSGNSMAVPHVSGVLALLISFAPYATAIELYTALLQSTMQENDGIVKALVAMEYLTSGSSLSINVIQNKTSERSVASERSVGQNLACFVDGSQNGKVPVRVILKTDLHPFETSIQLAATNVTNLGSHPDILWTYSNLQQALQKYVFRACVDETACHVLTIWDPNGLCCDWGLGGYQVFSNGKEVAKGAIFQDSVTVKLGDCSGNDYGDALK